MLTEAPIIQGLFCVSAVLPCGRQAIQAVPAYKGMTEHRHTRFHRKNAQCLLLRPLLADIPA